MTAYQAVKIGCLLLITLVIGIAGVEFALTLRDARAIELQTHQAIETLNAGLPAVMANVRKASDSLVETSATFSTAADEEKQYWEKSKRNLDKILIDTRTDLAAFGRVIDRAHQAIAHTDTELNEQLLPSLVSSIAAGHDTAVAATQSIQTTTAALEPILKNVATTTANIAAVSERPELQQTLVNLAKTTEETAATMEETRGTMEHLKNTAAYGEAYAKRVTAPANAVWSGILAVGHFVSAFGPALGRLF